MTLEDTVIRTAEAYAETNQQPDAARLVLAGMVMGAMLHSTTQDQLKAEYFNTFPEAVKPFSGWVAKVDEAAD